MGCYTENVISFFYDENGYLREFTDENEIINTIEQLRKEYICSAAYFLVKRCIEEKSCKHENGKLEYEIKKGLIGNKRKKVFIFDAIDMGMVEKLSDEKKRQYVEILKSLVLENNPEESLKEWNEIFRMFFFPKNKKRLITKEEALRIAHGLQFTLDTTQAFLSRVLEEDMLNYTKAEDVIEIFSFLHKASNSSEKVKELKEFYKEKAANIPKMLIHEKPENQTINIKYSLENYVKEQEGNLSRREVKKIDETSQMTYMEDPVEDWFKEWLLKNAEFFDVPSKKGFDFFKLFISATHAKWFPERFYNLFQVKISFPEGKGIEYLFNNIILKSEKLKKIKFDTDIARTVTNDIIDHVNKYYEEKISQGQKAKNVLGYITVTREGNFSFENFSLRLINILIGEENVKKGDMLLAIYLFCLASKSKTDNKIDLFEQFLSASDDVLQSSNLPQFYVPHLLESTFLMSILQGGENTGTVLEAYGSILKIGRGEPAEREREAIQADDITKEKRNKREQLKRSAKSITDLEGIEKALSEHFLKNFESDLAYWFKADGIYCEKEHRGAFKIENLEKVCSYEKEETKEKFDETGENYKNAFKGRYQFLISVGNYLSRTLEQNSSYRCSFRTTCKEIPAANSGTYIAIEKLKKIELAGTEHIVLKHFMDNMDTSKRYVFREDGIYFNDERLCKYENEKLNIFQPTNKNYANEKERKKRKEVIKELCDYLIPMLERHVPNVILGIKISDGILQDISLNKVTFSNLLIVANVKGKQEILEHYIANFEKLPEVEYLFDKDGIYSNGNMICEYFNNELFHYKNNTNYLFEKKEREKVLNSTKEFLKNELGKCFPQNAFKVSIDIGVSKANAPEYPSKIRIVAKK